MREQVTAMMALGDCFEAAGKYIIDHGLRLLGSGPAENPGLILVHGEVMHSFQGFGYGHAWVEDGNTVIDKSNGRNIRMPKGEYYNLGGVEVFNNMHRYTPEQTRKKILQYKHWGPWDLKTSSGL